MKKRTRSRSSRERKPVQPLRRPYHPYKRNDQNALLIYYFGYWFCVLYLHAQLAQDLDADPQLMEPDRRVFLRHYTAQEIEAVKV